MLFLFRAPALSVMRFILPARCCLMLLSRISLLFFWTSVFDFATILVVTVLDTDLEATFDSFFLL